MTDDAKAAMLAALNGGEAVEGTGDGASQKQWGIVSIENGRIWFEPHPSEKHAYETHALFFSHMPAHVVSRLGGWQIEV